MARHFNYHHQRQLLSFVLHRIICDNAQLIYVLILFTGVSIRKEILCVHTLTYHTGIAHATTMTKSSLQIHRANLTTQYQTKVLLNPIHCSSPHMSTGGVLRPLLNRYCMMKPHLPSRTPATKID